MFCVNCGCRIEEGSTCCQNCGARVFSGAPLYSSVASKVWKAVCGSVNWVANMLNVMAGGSGHMELNYAPFFDSVFKRHERGEASRLFACGTPETAPSLANVSSAWPHPWVYSRVFAVLCVSFIGLWIFSGVYGNPCGYPGFMFVGALMVPFSVAVFFFETNVARNLSLARVIEIFFVGGVLSLLCVYPLHAFFPGAGTDSVVPAMITGFVEELAKVLAIALFFRRIKGRHYVLTGLLIGSAVGAGFAVFETAGHMFASLGGHGIMQGFDGMARTAVLRSCLAPGGHVAWAAVEGGALALCDEGHGFEPGQLASTQFLRFLAVSVVFHGVWDATPVPVLDWVALPFFVSAKYVLLIFAVWIVIYVLLRRGLAQIGALSRGMEHEVAFGGSLPSS